MSNPIKLIIFDMDGVLVNSRILHYKTFRDAVHSLRPDIYLSWSQHEEKYDGLSTRLKIKNCIENGIIEESNASLLFDRKQKLTREQISTYVKPRESLISLLENLIRKGYRIICASNSIRATVDETLRLLSIEKLFEKVYSNEDVIEAKPSPEIYKKAMNEANIEPQNTLIIEDSIPGRKSAYASGAHVLEVEDAEDVTEELIDITLEQLRKDGHITPRHKLLTCRKEYLTKNYINIVIPMAGEGSRFRVAGYKNPKPFIQVAGKPMIRWVLENMLPKTIPENEIEIVFHLILRKSHLKSFDIHSLFKDMPKNVSYTYHITDGLTEGAACSVLLAEELINNKEPLVIVNSDQYLEWNADIYYKTLLNPTYDGNILTFYQPDVNDKKWSYARLDKENMVEEVAEKVWISPYATVGLYGWKHGSDYVEYAKQMIQKNTRVNNEFYVCPVYNEAIKDGKKIRVKLCSGMWGLGVPEDLEKFCKEYLKKEDAIEK